jgi:acetyl-CoA carboxylase carboxyl transferase subunit alpha
MGLQTPVVSVVLGFGGSGGALAIGVCDELAMLENSLFFVISPRGFASILWKDPSREAEAITVMKGSAEDLVEFGVCDTIIPESWLVDAEKSNLDVETTAGNIQNYLCGALNRLNAMPSEQLVENRYQKFRAMGRWKG